MKFVIDNIGSKTIICSEISLHHYKNILKCTYGDEPCERSFIETLVDILEDLTSENKDFYLDLNIFELLVCLIEFRRRAMGDNCSVVYEQDSKKITLEINLKKLKEKVKFVSERFSNCSVSEQHIKIFLKPPSLRKLLTRTDEEYLYFIQGISINSETTYNIIDTSTAETLFNSLPPKVSLKIVDSFNQTVSDLLDINLLSEYPGVKQNITMLPTIASLLWFTKLFFNEALDSFYSNIFYLSHVSHLNSLYLDKCTPGEYIFFAKKMEEVASKNKETSEGPDAEDPYNIPQSNDFGYSNSDEGMRSFPETNTESDLDF